MNKPECPLCRVRIHCNHCDTAESDMFNEHRTIIPNLCRKLQQRNRELQQQLERKHQIDSDAIVAARMQSDTHPGLMIPVRFDPSVFERSRLTLTRPYAPVVAIHVNGANRDVTRRVINGARFV